MTSPNFENIDLWLFDYIEGNLSTYQKELLEGYLLNHPELEVDLDSWKMSTLPLSDNFVNDIHINKKKENRYAYYFTTFLGAAIILLIGQSDHLQFTINDTESKIYQSNNKQDFTDNVTPFTIIGTSTPSKNKTSSPLEHKGNHNNIIHQDVIPIYIAVANEEVTGENNMTFAEGTQLFASGNHLISIQLSPIKLPYQSTGQLSFKNSEFIDLAFTDERKIKKEHSLSGFMLKTK